MHRDHFKQPKIYATTPREKEYYNTRALLFYCFIALLLLLAIWFLFFSSYFKIKKIIISGSLNADISSEINKFVGKNIFTFRIGKIEHELAQKQTSIASLEIYKGLPDSLKVKVNVRDPKIVWQTQEKTYFIDINGIVFAQGDSGVLEKGQPLPLIIDTKNAPIEVGTRIVSANFVQFVLDLNKDFPQTVGANVSELKIGETTFQIEAVSDQGWRVYLDTTRDLHNQLVSLKKVLDQYREQIHEYVDLRVEGRAYYK